MPYLSRRIQVCNTLAGYGQNYPRSSSAMNVGVVHAEAYLPPYSKLPRPEESLGRDPRDGTIDTDADFKKFCSLYESLTATQSAGKPANWAALRDLPLSITYPAGRVEAAPKPASPAIAALVQFLVEKKNKRKAEAKAKKKAAAAKTAETTGAKPAKAAPERESGRPGRGKKGDPKRDDDTAAPVSQSKGTAAAKGAEKHGAETPAPDLAAAFKAALSVNAKEFTSTSSKPAAGGAQAHPKPNTGASTRGGKGRGKPKE